MEEDIYGDLENYNDVNALDELRKENQELKYKVEEYASTIARLQKDIDKVNLEFKTMEINFSSLLKTARAEIERKTQIINSLNLEKDKLVFSALQNNNRNILNIKKNIEKGRSLSRSKRESEGNKLSKDCAETKKMDTERGRKDDNRLPSIDTVSSLNTEESNKNSSIDNNHGKKTAQRSDETKENVCRSQSIKSRRKSMPAINYPKFSSDEEDNVNYSHKDKNRMDRYIKDDKRRKPSETSGIDDKYSSYHESSRDTYYRESFSKTNDKYRNSRNRKESPRRQKKLSSPERSNRYMPKEHYNDHSKKWERGLHRRSESPPTQKRSSYHRNRSRERRPNAERERYDRSRSRHDRYGYKHKLLDYEELAPATKRARTDSSGRHFEEFHEVREVVAETNIPKHLEVQNESCQSPDFANSTSDVNPAKEVMDSAATHFEDPRLTSNRYIKQTHNDNVTFISVSGKEVDLIPIGTTKWNIHRVDVPEALRQPPDDTDRLVERLYEDINPVFNATVESGEIQSEFGDHLDDIVSETHNIYGDIQMKEPDEIVNIVNKEKQIEDTRPKENTTKTTQYKIPKIKKSDKESVSQSTNPLGKLFNEFNITTPSIESVKSSDKLDVDKLYSPDKESNNKPDNNNTKDLGKVKKSLREMVEGDLELSDETSDNIEITRKRKSKSSERSENRKSEETYKDCVSQTVNDKKIKPITLKIAKDKNTQYHCIEQKKDDTKSISDSNTKHKSKKKSHKIKRNSQSDKSPTENNLETEKKKSKSKKESKPKQEIKAKLNDLFGESSSLITPEDLGAIRHEEAQPSSKYVPIFEDAQDAIDMSLTPIKSDLVALSNKSTESTECVKTPTEIESSNPKPVKENKSNELSKEKRNRVDEAEKPNPSINLYPGPLVTEPDVVNTVIISTGVQPRRSTELMETEPFLGFDSNQKDLHNDIMNTRVFTTSVQPHVAVESIAEPFLQNNERQKEDILQKAESIFKNVTAPKALFATSTPHKSFSENDVNSRVPESSCNSSESKIVRNDDSYDTCQSNGMVNGTPGDIPDVRIFVKRRRKVLKKAVSK